MVEHIEKTYIFPLHWNWKEGLNSFMTKLHKSSVSKKSLIQPVRFRTWERGLCKMPPFETPSFQMGVFKMWFTVASGISQVDVLITQCSHALCFSWISITRHNCLIGWFGLMNCPRYMVEFLAKSTQEPTRIHWKLNDLNMAFWFTS